VFLCQSPRRSWLALTRTLQGGFRPRGTRVRFLISVSPSICILAHICIIRLRAGIKRTFAILIFGQPIARSMCSRAGTYRVLRIAEQPFWYVSMNISRAILFTSAKFMARLSAWCSIARKKRKKNPARGGFLARYFFSFPFVSIFSLSFFLFFFFFLITGNAEAFYSLAIFCVT